MTPDKNMGRVAIEGWITLEQGRKLLTMRGPGLRLAQGAGGDARVQAGAARRHRDDALKNTLRTIDSKNVVGEARGQRSAAEERVRRLHGALGSPRRSGRRSNGDTIYNGARDNASGTAGMLEIARAFTQAARAAEAIDPVPAVTAEEQGLLGSQYYAVTPLYPLAKTLANINIDGVNQWGRTKDLTLIGLGASDLDDYARDAAGEQGRTLRRTRNRRRASTTAPITSTSRSLAFRRSIPMKGSSTSASRRSSA